MSKVAEPERTRRYAAAHREIVKAALNNPDMLPLLSYLTDGQAFLETWRAFRCEYRGGVSQTVDDLLALWRTMGCGAAIGARDRAALETFVREMLELYD